MSTTQAVQSKEKEKVMNKQELIVRVAKDLEKTQAEVAPVVGKVFDVIQDRLYQEEPIKIADFGTFETVKRAARTGRNPATGEPVEIAAKNAVHFKPAKALKEYIQD